MFWFREKFVKIRIYGHSVGGRPLYAVQMGEGEKRIMVSACHHANEWLTGLCLWGALEEYAFGLRRGDLTAATGFSNCTLLAVPWVNPDGAALLTCLGTAEEYAVISSPPERWKANLNGVDLNLNYPACWESAAEHKRRLGVTDPGPRDWPGKKPLSEPETLCLAELTEDFAPDMVVALHSQGEEIYANFRLLQPAGTKKAARSMERALGYPVVTTPPESDAAGYKDWFIQEFDKPGFTVEMGLGENPLPLASFAPLCNKICRLLSCLTAGD